MFRDRPIIRSGYLVLAALFTAYTLSIYAVYLQQFISAQYSFGFELGMVAGQVLFQSLWLWKRNIAVKWEYTFHLLTVSLLGSVLLWVFIGLHYWLRFSASAALICFCCVVVCMFLEHRRRIVLLRLPFYLSYTWVLYRILILCFIL